MKVVILAGGLGTRLSEQTEIRPKPLVEIGGKPILWHIMKTYSSFGFTEFVIALGYKGEMIKDYFLKYHYMYSDFLIQLNNGQIDIRNNHGENWTVHLIDTGFNTQTGGRIKRLASVIGDETFLLTYGDGVGNVNIQALIEFHRNHQKIATITAVRPPARFGGLTFDGDLVSEFVEKPQIGEGWINGGFFVMEPKVFDLIEGDQTYFEREPLEWLASHGELAAYRHEGFWQCMDTQRDVKLLENLWQTGEALWKIW